MTQTQTPTGGPVRALFLSDFHFGYKGVDCNALLECITAYTPDIIYLVGDIIDGWKLAKRWHWNPEYTQIIDALVDHRKRGAEIVYLPGNHDERVRSLNPFRRTRLMLRMHITIRNTCMHRMKDGRRMIVMHGDQFDNALIRGRVSKFGDWLHDILSHVFNLHGLAPIVMIEGKPKRFSLAKAIMKKSGKMALRLLNNLERLAIRRVKRKGADGFICGHTHVPVLKTVQGRYVFANCGMWMGHTNTCLVETTDGDLKLVHWPDRHSIARSVSPCEATRIARHPETAFLIRKIQKLWSGRERLGTQSIQGKERIIDQEGRDFLDIVAEPALIGERGAQA